jgi:PAS domain S-box-containing protein
MGIDKNRNLVTATTELRRHAEERMRARSAELQPPRTAEEAQRLVHELEVHQIELEMQNEALLLVQEGLELSRNTYAELYDFAPVGYFTFDVQGRIREVNLAGARLLGIERRMLIDRPFAGFIVDAAGRETFSNHLETVLNSQGMQRCKIKLTGEDGSVIHGLMQSATVDTIKSKGGCILSSIVDGTVGKQLADDLQTAHDNLEAIVQERTGELARANMQLTQEIEERRRAEDALYEAQQVFRALVENSPDIIARYDRECRRTYVNPTYLKTAQIAREELLATAPLQRSPLSEAGAAILHTLLRRVLDSGVAEAVDVVWPKADNLDYWYNICAFPEFNREGRVISVMTISRDINERKRTEQELHRLNEELDQRVQERTAELSKKNDTLETMNRFLVSRELRMTELKDMIKEQQMKLDKLVR